MGSSRCTERVATFVVAIGIGTAMAGTAVAYADPDPHRPDPAEISSPSEDSIDLPETPGSTGPTTRKHRISNPSENASPHGRFHPPGKDGDDDDPPQGRRIPRKVDSGREDCDHHEPPAHEPEEPTPSDTPNTPDEPTTKPETPIAKADPPPPFKHDSGLTAPPGFGVVPDPPHVQPEPVSEPEPPQTPPPAESAPAQQEIPPSDPIIETPHVIEIAAPVPVAVEEAPAAPAVVAPAASPAITLTSRVGTGTVALTVILIVLITGVWFYANRLASHLTVRRNHHA